MAYYLEYPLEKGFIHNWLVTGPQMTPVSNLEQFGGAEPLKLQIARHYDTAAPGVDGAPVADDSFQADGQTLTLTIYRCLDDHFVDWSTFCHTWHYLRAWAFAQVQCQAAQMTSFVLTTNGPADVWINGEHVHRQAHFYHQEPCRVAFQAELRQGVNDILVRAVEVAARECPYVMALQMADPAQREGVVVRVPTNNERTDRWQLFERLFDHAYAERNVWYKGNEIFLRWSDELPPQEVKYLYQIQDSLRRAYLEGFAEAGQVVDVGHPARLWEKPYFIALRPTPQEYYQMGLRYERRIPIHVLDTEYSTRPYGTWEERRQEALEHAAKRENNLFAEIAKMALGQWERLDESVILESVAGINRRGDCSDFYLAGLLGVMYRYMDNPAFPPALRQPLQDCVLGFKYWFDEPGSDAMCYTTENHSILFHTCEILAGQLYPDRVFGNAGQTGQWHRLKGEQLALAWLRKRGTTGFLEWNSNCYFEEDLLALSHLADLAENDEVGDLAAVLMDKLLFVMALNSYQGVFGASHGRTYTPMIKGGQLEPTSGISRLMWGMGVWNQHIRGVVALACSAYELPFIIADIAAEPQPGSPSAAVWSREHHTGSPEAWRASGSLGNEVNLATYKTPYYMLCSAQDYHPGEKGYQQHIWQATLGPDAVVFVTHPPCCSEEGSHRPNFWHGNVILPRVVQWRDALIAIHQLPADDWMGFTHAYFPTQAFDQYIIRDGWAFAQKGGGYLALTACQGIELVQRGPGAYQELRSSGTDNVWLCQMGHMELDHSLEDFHRRVLALDVEWAEQSVRWRTLRGDELAFGWQGPLTVNGQEQPITGFKHYENPYCVADLPAEQMEIRLGEYLLRLDFSLRSQG